MLLFGAETWVVTPNMDRSLSGFLHGAARRLTGRQAQRERDGEWYYPSLEGAMREAGLTDIRKSTQNRQNTVAQYIATQPLLDLCEGARAREGGEGTAKVVGPGGHRLGDDKGEGSRARQDGRVGNRHGREGRARGREQGKRVQRGGMERGECG